LSETQFLDQIRQHQGIIYKLVALYAADQEEKKDLYQEILLQAWKGYPSFRGDSKFSTWLYRISLNTLLSHKRKVNRVRYEEDLEPLSPAVAAGGIAQEDSRRLQQALRRLGETDRAIISLQLEGYDNAEIAQVLGITPNHVAVKLHRAKQQLANLLTH
jgi:RNA polymerase sigma factor (sigma-70 family)